jgi:co-chaperonin GroES (HSP10)
MTPEQIQPTREILFIERRMEDDKFENSAIIRPGTFQNEMSIAKVLAVGPDVTGIVVGDSIYVGKLAGLKVVELKGPYFLVNQNEVLAVVGE